MNKNFYKIYPEILPLTLPSVVKNKNTDNGSIKLKKVFNNDVKKLPEISSPKNNTIYDTIKKMNESKEKFIMEYMEEDNIIVFEEFEKV